MKKIFVLLVAVLMLFNMAVIPSYAEDNISLNVDFNAEKNSFSVSGYVVDTRDRIPMALRVKKSGEIIATEYILAVGITGNKVSFAFPEVILSATTTSGDIVFDVVSGFTNYSAQDTKYYLGVDTKFAALKEIDTAINNNDAADLATKIESTRSILGADSDLLINLSDDSRIIALDYMMQLNLNIQEGSSAEESYDTEEECYAIFDQIEVYQEHYKEAIVLASFFDLESSAAIKEWYDKYKAAYGFSDDILGTAVDEKDLLPYFDDAIASEGYLQRIDSINYVRSLNDLNIQMKNQAILQRVQDANQNVIKHIVEDLSDLLTNVSNPAGNGTVSINSSGWAAIKQAGKESNVCVSIIGNNYTTIYDFVNDINNKIAEVISGLSTGNNQPVSDRPNKKGGQPVVAPVENAEQTAPIMAFDDIKHVSWAQDAIRYLYTNGIISGRDAVTFAPDDNVTRAELIKMLVISFNLKGTNSATFADVPLDSWYAKYVSIGQSNDIINGDSNGNFNPNRPVSRQDASVMMYRVCNSAFKTDKSDFKDYNSIAEYAKDAVDYMYAEDVINGVGDGKFAPNANLTRAQAAKMIYKLLTK